MVFSGGKFIPKARMILSSKHCNQGSINNLLSGIAIFSLPNSGCFYSPAEEDYSFLSSSSMSRSSRWDNSSAMHAYSHITSIIRQFRRYHVKIIRYRVSSFATASSSSWEIPCDSCDSSWERYDPLASMCSRSPLSRCPVRDWIFSDGRMHRWVQPSVPCSSRIRRRVIVKSRFKFLRRGMGWPRQKSVLSVAHKCPFMPVAFSYFTFSLAQADKFIYYPLKMEKYELSERNYVISHIVNVLKLWENIHIERSYIYILLWEGELTRWRGRRTRRTKTNFTNTGDCRCTNCVANISCQSIRPCRVHRMKKIPVNTCMSSPMKSRCKFLSRFDLLLSR